MLEQTAEEATELAFACLKLARFYRGDNKVHGRTVEEMFANLEEEMADIYVCFDELEHSKLIDSKNLEQIIKDKKNRMAFRLVRDHVDTTYNMPPSVTSDYCDEVINGYKQALERSNN